MSKLALLNLNPYYANSTTDYTLRLDLSMHEHGGQRAGKQQVYVKRLTAPYVDSRDAADVTWAGQSFSNATAGGQLRIQLLGGNNIVEVRGSEAVLVFFE